MLATINPKLLAWLWLVLAIITEVLGSSFLKLAQSMSYGFLVTAFFICVSYYFIGLAIKQISVSVAYAMWEVLGVICIVLIGIWYFDENLALVQYAGIVCAVVGILLINFGEVSDEDSALGSHSSDFVDFGTTADHKSSSAPKSTKSTASTTAIPRILEEEKRAECENPTQILESQNGFTKQAENLESTFDKNAKLQKKDSSPNAHFSVIASRDSGVAIHKGAKVDSSNDYSAGAEFVDSKETSANAERYPLFSKEATLCHATATAEARNDRRNAESQKVDSSNAQSVSKPQAEGLKNERVEKANAQNTKVDSSLESKSTKLAHTIRTELGRFFKQFFPAMLGSSTAQIASFIDTILASFLASGAISYLYYANRIFQLPLAIFAIAISTALFPMVAKAIKAGQEQKALLAMKRAFWFLLFMLLVCAVGGIMLREQIIWLLYEHGKFSRADTLECAMVFGAYMAGLVPFGCARIFSLYLYSHSKQALAAKISAISLLVGVVFSLVLMQFWGAFGLALAGSLSGFVLFALTIRAFGFGEFWAIICARNYALWLGVVLVCEVLLLMLWLHYIHI